MADTSTQKFSLDQYSDTVKDLIAKAQQEAKDRYATNTNVWHFILGSLSVTDCQPFYEDLRNNNVDMDVFERVLRDQTTPSNERYMDFLATDRPTPPLEADFGATLVRGRDLALMFHEGAAKVEFKDVLLAVLESSNARDAFRRMGVTSEVLSALKGKWYKQWYAKQDANPNGLDPSSALAQYCDDLTAQARQGKLDPIVGRTNEIRETMNVLQRRTQNNPVFVGEPGVGKTALINGLALRMMKNEVPETLKNKHLLSLNLIGLTSGAGPTEIEKRVKSLIEQLKDNSDVILFIDDLHTLVSNTNSSISMVGQMLKPALARGEIRCIGSASPDEYRVHLEKDIALERRFQKIMVEEPTAEEAIGILRGLKETYALYHGVEITDSAIVAAVELSSRYLRDRSLPAKAIDLMDGAAARVRTTLDSRPANLERLERNLIEWKVQREMLKKEEAREGQLDSDTADRLLELENNIQAAEKQAVEVETQWNTERQLHNEVLSVREEIAAAQRDLAEAEHTQNLIKITQLQQGVLSGLEAKLRGARQAVQEIKSPLLHDQVGADQIADVVSQRTGIPISKMSGNEQQKLAQMEDILNSEVVGQEDAVEAIADSIRRSRAGLSDANKPIGSFLFMGPTGVGKTELTKQLSTFLFEDPNAMVRVDMSEYMEKHNVSRLIGPPPGYVGYEEGGMLSEAVRARPYSVVLFDEMEKAHPDVFNLLLQVLDDGHLTDSRGRKIDFKNTVIIMTSNAGAQQIQDLTSAGADKQEIKDEAMKQLRSFLRPEFINRLDETVVFNPLDKKAIGMIAKLQVKKLIGKLKRNKIEAVITNEAVAHLTDVGFDPLMGARPLKRAFQQELENVLAKKIVTDEIRAGDKVVINAVEGKLTWTVVAPTTELESEAENDHTAEVVASSVANKATNRRKAAPAAARKKALS